MIEDLKNCKYGLIAIEQTNKSILHWCFYESQPTDYDKKMLEDELNIDPEFELVGRINKDVFVVEADNNEIQLFLNNL